MGTRPGSSYYKLPVVSKLYCSSSEEVMLVRRRPHVVNGGGFVVTDAKQSILFRIDGCGILGIKGELILRDSKGNDLLLIRKKGGIVQALSLHNKWKGYNLSYGAERPVFTLKDHKNSCIATSAAITISAESSSSHGANYFQIRGFFPGRDCTLVDPSGNVLAQVGGANLMGGKDVYQVAVKAGVDQAFVFGVIAVLDYIYGESTRC